MTQMMTQIMKPFTEDKLKAWGDGPWVNEPDFAEFEYEGFPCVVNRTPRGIFCGYVGIAESHPWANESFDIESNVHGGITFNEISSEFHIPVKAQAARWVGFDCYHWGDLSPHDCRVLTERELYDAEVTYRTLGYAINETKLLAREAATAITITTITTITTGDKHE